ncbi:MAG: hypothetical protein NTZ51_03155 [Proteobacteria bacterium]|nr:hypothetical protein [Pseudomonadota bacterium]
MAMQKTNSVTASIGEGAYQIEAELKRIGNDILVSVWGGTKPHIGSVAVATPRQSLKDPAKISATSSVITMSGHKDDVVAKLFAEKIAAVCNGTSIVTAGIHIDNASKRDIETIVKNCETLCNRLLKKLE